MKDIHDPVNSRMDIPATGISRGWKRKEKKREIFLVMVLQLLS